MKLTTRFLLVIGMSLTMAVSAQPRGAAEDESLGDKIKRLFVRPTPTPKPKRHKKSITKKKATPTPSPSPSPSESPSPSVSPSVSASVPPTATVSPSASATASPKVTAKPSATPTATSSPKPSVTATPSNTPAATSSPQATATVAQQSVAPPAGTSPLPRQGRSQYFEPVRPIAPGPGARFRPNASPTPENTAPPPKAVAVPVAKSPLPKAVAVPVAKPTNGPTASISAAEISGSESYPPEVRKIIDLGLSLTTQNLGYKYGSADPANGGMDCSGFIYYVLSKSGIKEVPRDAREQYIWVRKAGNFQAVLAHNDDTFELDALKPGDLLFWTAAYSVSRDPDITHTMIYLGREKATNQRVMVGASDGRTYRGQQRLGVSTFDFKVPRPTAKNKESSAPVFVGYGRIPGLRTQ
jgi:peptidoglycan DL-endopeptidase CwlO